MTTDDVSSIFVVDFTIADTVSSATTVCCHARRMKKVPYSIICCNSRVCVPRWEGPEQEQSRILSTHFPPRQPKFTHVGSTRLMLIVFTVLFTVRHVQSGGGSQLFNFHREHHADIMFLETMIRTQSSPASCHERVSVQSRSGVGNRGDVIDVISSVHARGSPFSSLRMTVSPPFCHHSWREHAARVGVAFFSSGSPLLPWSVRPYLYRRPVQRPFRLLAMFVDVAPSACDPLSTRIHKVFFHRIMCLFDTSFSSCAEFVSFFSSTHSSFVVISSSLCPELPLPSFAPPGPLLLSLAAPLLCSSRASYALFSSSSFTSCSLSSFFSKPISHLSAPLALTLSLSLSLGFLLPLALFLLLALALSFLPHLPVFLFLSLALFLLPFH